MKCCECIQRILCKAAYLGHRLLEFHISFGKQYVKQLIEEIKDIRTVKNN